MPTVRRYMTAQPHTINQDAKMSEAHRMMREHEIRHLPVLHSGKLVGIVSLRDLHLIETLPGTDPDEATVEEAMTVDVYTVDAEAPVDDVLERMADRKYGAAVVTDKRGQVAGIFTSIDAMQFFAEVLRRQCA